MCESKAEKRLKDIVFENTKDNNDEGIVYHYTTPNGFLNIINTNCYYASHFKYFNDPSEFKYGITFINDVIKKRLSKENKKTIISKLGALNFEDINEISKEIEQLYALSFSENGDLLSQWQAYAKDGEGYSIGIKKKYISKAGLNIFDIKDDIYFIKMIYSEKISKQIADEFYNVLSNKILSDNNDTWKHYYYKTIPYLGMIMKHDAYESEKEWRVIYKGSIIFSDEGNFNYREKNNDIIPYIKLYFGKNGICSPKEVNSAQIPIPIEKINIGPTTNTEETVIQFFLRKVYGNTPVPYVNKSECPYRNTN